MGKPVRLFRVLPWLFWWHFLVAFGGFFCGFFGGFFWWLFGWVFLVGFVGFFVAFFVAFLLAFLWLFCGFFWWVFWMSFLDGFLIGFLYSCWFVRNEFLKQKNSRDFMCRVCSVGFRRLPISNYSGKRNCLCWILFRRIFNSFSSTKKITVSIRWILQLNISCFLTGKNNQWFARYFPLFFAHLSAQKNSTLHFYFTTSSFSTKEKWIFVGIFQWNLINVLQRKIIFSTQWVL